MQPVWLEVSDQTVMGEVGLGNEHSGALGSIGVFVGDSAPTSLNGRKPGLIPHRAISDELTEFLAVGEVRQTRFLDHRVGNIDAETIDSAVEPEPQHPVELLEDVGVLPVPVGLGGVEKVQVPLTGGAVRLGNALPGAAAKH